MTKREAGRLGGLKTVQVHGKAHMSKIGKRGFKRLCCKFPSNSRRLTLKYLNGKGSVKARYIPAPHPRDDQIAADLYREFDLE